jgi:hypothetical protein
MSFAELIRSSCSVRAYQKRDIPDAVLQRVLEAFVLAPTAANRQPIGLVWRTPPGARKSCRACTGPIGSLASRHRGCACTTPDKAWTRKDSKTMPMWM